MMFSPDSIENVKLLEQLANEKKTHNEQTKTNDEVTPLQVVEQSPMMSVSMSMQF